MTIRTKLIVMLVVPLAALAVVAIWAFREVNTESQALNDTGSAVTAIVGLEDLWSNLSAERLAVIGDQGVAEAIEATDSSLERLATIGGIDGQEVIELVTFPLPEDRSTASSQNYSEALDVVEAELRSQQIGEASADSILGTVFLEDAREASRIQEEAWIEIVEGDRDDLDRIAIRGLINESADAVAARQQSFRNELSTGVNPFAGPAIGAAENTLGQLEASFETQATFDVDGVEESVEQALTQLSNEEIIETLTESREAWAEATAAATSSLQDDVSTQFGEIDDTRSVALFVAGLGAFLLMTLLFVVGRSITGPLNRLMQNADTVTHERLPSAVAQLRTIGASDDDIELAPIPRESDDEIGVIADAFNDIQASALKVATDQARSRRNVAEMFVSLGRRNQQLNHRMITLISDLERDEQDEDTLRGLYQLDHIATRMRRNAESLLVLAGNRSPRQWSKPVPFDDVVRSSLAEVEYFDRIEIGLLPEIAMSGAVVADLTHMMAELLDNATQFSDPSTTVYVSAIETYESVRLEIIDSGFGIDAEDLEALNERVTNPPELDRAPSRLLGLFVVGRLAKQHNVHVELQSSPGEGTVAFLDIPKSHFPEEIGENPIQVAPVELNSDNASDFFASEALETRNIEAPVADDLPIDVPVDEEPVQDLPIDVPVAETPQVEVPEEDVPEVDVPAVEVPQAEAVEAPMPEVEQQEAEAPVAQASAGSAVAAATGDSLGPNPLLNDSWPLTKLDPAPEQKERPLEAVQRDARTQEETSTEHALEEVAAPQQIEEVVEQVEEANEMPVPPMMSTPEPAPSAGDSGSALAGLPTRMPQATIETVQVENSVIPLEIEPDTASTDNASHSAFGMFAKGVEAGLDDVTNEGEES